MLHEPPFEYPSSPPISLISLSLSLSHLALSLISRFLFSLCPSFLSLALLALSLISLYLLDLSLISFSLFSLCPSSLSLSSRSIPDLSLSLSAILYKPPCENPPIRGVDRVGVGWEGTGKRWTRKGPTHLFREKSPGAPCPDGLRLRARHPPQMSFQLHASTSDFVFFFLPLTSCSIPPHLSQPSFTRHGSSTFPHRLSLIPPSSLSFSPLSTPHLSLSAMLNVLDPTWGILIQLEDRKRFEEVCLRAHLPWPSIPNPKPSTPNPKRITKCRLFTESLLILVEEVLGVSTGVPHSQENAPP